MKDDASECDHPTDGAALCCAECGREITEASDADDLWCPSHGFRPWSAVINRVTRIIASDGWRSTRYERLDGTYLEVSIPAWRPRGEYGPFWWDNDAEAEMVERIQNRARRALGDPHA